MNNITEQCDALKSCILDEIEANDDGGYSDDATWVLTSSFVILTMQSGFGLLECGSVRPGNEVNILMKNVMDVVFGSLAYYSLGYGISYGYPSNPFMGLGNFFPDGSNLDPVLEGESYSKYLFQFSFAATAATIVSGCVAMRMKFFVYCIFSFFAVVFYSFTAHWVWGDDGWLAQLGYYDFAGGGPVHLLGGTFGIVAIMMLGPRTGRFDGSTSKEDFVSASPTSILFGFFMLWWGWIGFNCGSTFGITGDKWIVAARAGISTINGATGGGVVAIIYSLTRRRGKGEAKILKVDHLVNGILGALVTTSPTCSVVRSYDSLIIGGIGALVSLSTNKFVERSKLDDPVGAIGVHAGGGAWGLIAVGLFADKSLPGVVVKDGLFRGGGFELLGYQFIGILSIIAWGAVCSATVFYLTGIANSKNLLNPRAGLRVTPEEERIGADSYVHGISNEMYEYNGMNIDSEFFQKENDTRGANRITSVFGEGGTCSDDGNEAIVDNNTKTTDRTDEPEEDCEDVGPKNEETQQQIRVSLNRGEDIDDCRRLEQWSKMQNDKACGSDTDDNDVFEESSVPSVRFDRSLNNSSNASTLSLSRKEMLKRSQKSGRASSRGFMFGL